MQPILGITALPGKLTKTGSSHQCCCILKNVHFIDKTKPACAPGAPRNAQAINIGSTRELKNIKEIILRILLSAQIVGKLFVIADLLSRFKIVSNYRLYSKEKKCELFADSILFYIDCNFISTCIITIVCVIDKKLQLAIGFRDECQSTSSKSPFSFFSNSNKQ